MVETSSGAVAIYHACHQARIAHHHSSPHVLPKN
jgi:hypothetical protein